MRAKAPSRPAYPSLFNRPARTKTLKERWAAVMTPAIAQPTRAIWYRVNIVKILSAEERHRGWAPKRGPFMTTVVRSAYSPVLESINIQL